MEVKVKLLSRVQLLATPWTAAYQAPPSMGFSRQEYWSGVPLPSPLVSIVKCKKHSYYIELFILYCIYLFTSLYSLFVFFTNFKYSWVYLFIYLSLSLLVVCEIHSQVTCLIYLHTVFSAYHLTDPQFISVAQSCPTLGPHESQHSRPPCPSPTPGAHPNPCPLRQWCQPTDLGSSSFSVPYQILNNN